METNTYTILEEKRTDVEKKLNRLQKKAQKYSIPFSVSYGEPYCITIKQKNDNGYIVENKYEVFDLTIESDIIRKDGYTVIAHIEHADNGNIVNVFDDEINKNWIALKPFCSHCNANHNLKYTFIVANGNEQKQVGRSCLKEYCGIDPQVIGMMNQFADDIDEYTPEGYDFHDPIPMVYSTTEILAHAIEITEEQGYVKSDEYNSNKGKLIKVCGNYPSDTFYKKAEEMEKAIAEMSIDDAIDNYLNNVQVRIKGEYCKPSDFGYFAYAPTAFARYIAKKEKEQRKAEANKAIAENSEYIGSVGERIELNVKEMNLLTSFFTEYGQTFLYRFVDDNDNVLIWFASSAWEDTNVKRIKATIKAHNERDGIKQTMLTRVKRVA